MEAPHRLLGTAGAHQDIGGVEAQRATEHIVGTLRTTVLDPPPEVL